MKIIHSHNSLCYVHGRFRDHVSLRANNKSDLVACLEYFTTSVPAPAPSARTFSDYADTVFQPLKDSCNYMRHSVLIWKGIRTFLTHSITSATRHIMGKGTRSRVLGKRNAPSHWKEFLRVDEIMYNCLSS